MKNADFDNYHESYDQLLRKQVGFFDSDSYFAEYKVKLVRKNVEKEPSTILEYGCGTGRNLVFLRQHFPASVIHGCDISEKSLESAAKKQPDARLFLIGRDPIGRRFDVILVPNVVHHIEPGLRGALFKDIAALLNDHGSLFVFEHNPYNPVTRHLVNSCPFDKGVVLVRPADMKNMVSGAGFRVVRLNYTLFFPALLKFLRFLEPLLAHLPLGGQYFVHAKKWNSN